MPKEFIVAIELGSSKMTGIAGQKNLDGSITVLATVRKTSTSFIQLCTVQVVSSCLSACVLGASRTSMLFLSRWL